MARVYSLEQLERKRECNRVWMRGYYATPEGKLAASASQKKLRATPGGREAKRAADRRWKKSENGKARSREWARKKYMPHPLPRLAPEEKKERAKSSYLRSINKPEVAAKRKETAWKIHLRKRYGITVEEFNVMAASGCNICGSKPTRRLHVDHCHSTGRVRGVLCDPCNRGLGCFEDDRGRIAKAIEYLDGGAGG